MPAIRNNAASLLDGVLKSPRRPAETDWAMAVTPVVAILWMVLILGLIIQQKVNALPPRPPTPTERAASTPTARAHWRRTYGALQRGLMAWQPRPPELGAVWSTRTGQICGLVDQWHTGVDYMTRFYTVGDRVFFKDDDLRGYMHQWSRCIDDPWVVLHPGSVDEGLCASRTGRQVWATLCKRA